MLAPLPTSTPWFGSGGSDESRRHGLDESAGELRGAPKPRAAAPAKLAGTGTLPGWVGVASPFLRGSWGLSVDPVGRLGVSTSSCLRALCFFSSFFSPGLGPGLKT